LFAKFTLFESDGYFSSNCLQEASSEDDTSSVNDEINPEKVINRKILTKTGFLPNDHPKFRHLEVEDVDVTMVKRLYTNLRVLKYSRKKTKFFLLILLKLVFLIIIIFHLLSLY
jgi:hypothetical protein